VTDLSSAPTSGGRRGGVVAAAIALTATTATVVAPQASADHPERTAHHTRSLRVHSGGPDAIVTFRRHHSGEGFVTMTVSARGVSWRKRHNESAVVRAYVDGHYATDVVITSSSRVTREFALGSLAAGRHTLRLHYAARRSHSRAGVARLRGIRFTTVRPSSRQYVADRFAPVLYGRNIAALGGRFENAYTDTPLVAWHEILPAAKPGHSIIEYSVIWSNEDGGTSTPALMAQWGRTTDIEWVYRVEVNAHGHRVRGTGVFQAAAHGTRHFHGRYDGKHPLLETCTSNNNMCDTIDDPMRFALSMRDGRPASQPREHLMDTHPWTYQVMAQEMLREHKIESPSRPSTPAVGNQRSYLYIALDHTTTPPASAGRVGLAVDVRLKGRSTTYTSNHNIAFWTINRDGPAATTVELPVGTTRADVASISVRRVPIGTDNGATLTVTAIERAFLLHRSYLPRPSFVHWHGSTVLTAGSPTAELWPPA
jgi:hypothetical protein